MSIVITYDTRNVNSDINCINIIGFKKENPENSRKGKIRCGCVELLIDSFVSEHL